MPGGTLIGDPTGYDRHARVLLGSLYRSIATDVARTSPPDARILEVGCGPGLLSVRLAGDHHFPVTGIDLDPAMIERARRNASRSQAPESSQPTFVVADVAALPFDDGAFDVVVSTFSLHHWSDPAAGLTEIARVLSPDGRVLIWDISASFRLFHVHAPDPVERVTGGPLRVTNARPWHWPWRISFAERIELARAE